jgi:hypothetical protein
MAGLVPAIHVLLTIGKKDVDARDVREAALRALPGHDDVESPVSRIQFSNSGQISP